MHSEIFTNQVPCCFSTDIAGQYPLYIWYQPDGREVYSSKNIVKLLEFLNDLGLVIEESSVGLSFLLQSGFVPPPYSAIKNLYIIGTGDSFNISKHNQKLIHEYSHEFKFPSESLKNNTEVEIDYSSFLEKIASSVDRNCDASKETFLFHSSGKDSNTVALALAEAGWQDRLKLVCHQSTGAGDESQLSAQLAKKMGFKHQNLNDVNELTKNHHAAIDCYFRNSPLPCLDTVCMAYPIYTVQVPELIGANIVDGSGNDRYMGALPSSKEKRTVNRAWYAQKTNFIRRHIPSARVWTSAFRTPAEYFGARGFSFRDSKIILPGAIDVFDYWRDQSELRSGWSLLDFKSDIVSQGTYSELFNRKIRNAADTWNSNLILPLADEKVVGAFRGLPEHYLYDQKTGRSKVILRDMLKNKLGLDSDQLGKFGYKVNYLGYHTMYFGKTELRTKNAYMKKLEMRLDMLNSWRQNSKFLSINN